MITPFEANAMAALALALAMGNSTNVSIHSTHSTITQVESAICKISYREGSLTYHGTGTIVGPPRPDGKWEILTAGHVVTGPNTKVNITTSNGEKLTAIVKVKYGKCDLAWLLSDQPFESTCVYLYDKKVLVGSKIWHKGWGMDKPGNKEVGIVTGYENSEGYLPMSISTSNGDSGCGFFLEDNKLVAVLMGGQYNNSYGGSSKQALRIRPKR